MKFSEAPIDERKRLETYLVEQRAKKSQQGIDVFDSLNKAMLVSNGGGVGVGATLLASQTAQIDRTLLSVSIVLFVVGICAFLVVRFNLARTLGNAAGAIAQFHLDVLADKSAMDQSSVNTRMMEITRTLDGQNPVLWISVPMVLFILAALLSCLGIFLPISPWGELAS